MTAKKQIKRATPSLLVLATCALVGCAGEPTTVTTTTTREVTTTGPATREVLVTQAPPVVRVETQPVSPGPGYIWTMGYWRWTGAQYVWVPGTLRLTHQAVQAQLVRSLSPLRFFSGPILKKEVLSAKETPFAYRFVALER